MSKFQKGLVLCQRTKFLPVYMNRRLWFMLNSLYTQTSSGQQSITLLLTFSILLKKIPLSGTMPSKNNHKKLGFSMWFLSLSSCTFNRTKRTSRHEHIHYWCIINNYFGIVLCCWFEAQIWHMQGGRMFYLLKKTLEHMLS